MFDRQELLKEQWLLRKNLSNLIDENIYPNQLDKIMANLIGVINNGQVEASCKFLKKMNEVICDATSSGLCYKDIANTIIPFAKEEMFLSMVDTFMERLDSKKRSELIIIEKEKYKTLLENLSSFKFGSFAIANLNQGLYDMTKEEMDMFFKNNSLKQDHSNYTDYMSNDLLKYYIVSLDLAIDSCNSKAECVNSSKNKDVSFIYGDNTGALEIGQKIKKQYFEIYKTTPFEEIKTNAFSQIAMEEVFPNRGK